MWAHVTNLTNVVELNDSQYSSGNVMKALFPHEP
jgi:hypothetical protein